MSFIQKLKEFDITLHKNTLSSLAQERCAIYLGEGRKMTNRISNLMKADSGNAKIQHF